MFLANPDDFSPMLAGLDVVRLANGSAKEGSRKHGLLYDDDGEGPRKSRIYLFDSEASLSLFEAHPDRYLRPVMQAMQAGSLQSLIRR